MFQFKVVFISSTRCILNLYMQLHEIYQYEIYRHYILVLNIWYIKLSYFINEKYDNSMENAVNPCAFLCMYE